MQRITVGNGHRFWQQVQQLLTSTFMLFIISSLEQSEWRVGEWSVAVGFGEGIDKKKN